MADEPILVNCPKCGRAMRHVDTTATKKPVDPGGHSKPSVWILECELHGTYHFGLTTPLTPGPPRESKHEEHERLNERTGELQHDHDDLSLDRSPFNKADHDQHAADLREHRENLRIHKLRKEDDSE